MGWLVLPNSPESVGELPGAVLRHPYSHGSMDRAIAGSPCDAASPEQVRAHGNDEQGPSKEFTVEHWPEQHW